MRNSAEIKKPTRVTAGLAFWLPVISLFLVLLTGSMPGFAQNLETPPDAEVLAQETNEDETDEAEDESADPTLSDSLPVGDVITSGREQYLDFMENLGFGSSLSARLIGTVAIVLVFLIGLAIARLITSVLHRKLRSATERAHISTRKFEFYYRYLYWLFFALLVIAACIALSATWNISLSNFVSSETALEILATGLTIYLMILVASIVLDVINGLLETSFRRWSRASSSRVDTLLPIAKNTVFVVIFVLFVLMMLAEIGINVMPLLAGAGVLGIAIGFGAQTLVKDLLNGFIIIFEDLIQVGDVATLAGKGGVVERITIRKVQLRDLAGTVFTVPFGEIQIVENMTKGFSYALLEVRVAYREDVDHICELLIQVAQEMQQEDDFKGDIMEPLEILGLDQFAESAVIVKARIKTLPIKQWRIAREFNRRMKKLFDQNSVGVPYPHQTIYFGEDKNGFAPPLRTRAFIEAEVSHEQEKKAAAAQTKMAPATTSDAGKPGKGIEDDATDAKIQEQKEKRNED